MIQTDCFAYRQEKEECTALKDLNDILTPKEENDDIDNLFIEALKGKTEDIWNDKE